MHGDAATAADTDWAQIVALYDQLLLMAPNPVVALNRAVAELDGPSPALAIVDDLDLDVDLDLDDYHLLHAVRAELLARVGRYDDADQAYDRALTLASNNAERALLERKQRALPGRGAS